MAKALHEITREKLDGFVQDFNRALLKQDMKAMNEAETNINKAVSDYKKQKADAVIFALSQEKDPILAAVQMMEYPIVKVRDTKKDKIVTGKEVYEAKAPVDLIKVAERAQLSTLWQYKVEKLALLLSMRVTKKIGGTSDDLKRIARDYRMNELARAEEMGATPDSDTQITKCIQMILDDILPGKGKANKYDANYMIIASGTVSRKEARNVKLIDARTAHRILVQVANRVVTNGKYGVEFRGEGGAVSFSLGEAEVSDAETVKVEAPAA